MSDVGLPCPQCRSNTHVKDSRPRDGGGIRRRRRCDGCGYRFTTLKVRAQDVSEVFGGADNLDPVAMRSAASLVSTFATLNSEDRLLLLGVARRLRGAVDLIGDLRSQLQHERRADA